MTLKTLDACSWWQWHEPQDCGDQSPLSGEASLLIFTSVFGVGLVFNFGTWAAETVCFIIDWCYFDC